MMTNSQRGRRNRIRGREGETEVVRILTAAGITAYRLSPPGDDLIIDGVTAEVKRRKDGFKEMYGWLESAGLLFMRADRKGWIVAMPIERYKELVKCTKS